MRRANVGVITGTALLGVAAVYAASILSKRPRKEEEKKRSIKPAGTSEWLGQIPESSLSSDHACVFELQDLNRSPSGRVGGAGALLCVSQGFHIRINELFDIPGLVLYSVELVKGKVLLVFMQVPSVPELFKAPFLDRGVRALAEIGSRVIVAPLEAMDNLRGVIPLDQLPKKEQSCYSIIWNTGRCGSTLMHKMLQKIGVLSFSEPFWLESIFNLPYKDGAFNAKIFCVCAAVDVLLVRKSLPAHPPIFGAASTLGSGYVSINPKGMGAVLMENLVELLPNAKHMLMYRDARKVAESFGSIMHRNKPPFMQRVFTFLSSRPRLKTLSRDPPHEGKPMPTLSMAVAEARRSGRLKDPTKPSVKSVTLNWLETMCVWKELIERGTLETDSYVSLRMEDFIRKDPELIEEVLRFFLGEPLEVGEDAVALALEAFKKHSQEGDPMSRSSHLPGSGVKKFLKPVDVTEIEKCLASVPSIGGPDFVFPGSMGLKEK